MILPSPDLRPLLFLAGVAFAYFVVMPAAVKFLLNFNDDQFNIQVRARDYYSFFSTTMLAGGVIFELPMAILAVTRLGIVTVEQLNRTAATPTWRSRSSPRPCRESIRSRC